jgi:hypothetical protein
MPTLDTNCQWAREIQSRIDSALPIDAHTRHNYAAAWLVEKLTRLNLPYKIYNLGAGVRRITTDTDSCPCCKRKL